MQLRVVLLKPPIPYHLDPSEQQPLGIAYIAAQTRKQGFQTSLIDLGNEKLTSQTIEKIPPANVYGITSTFLDLKVSHWLASHIKKKFPDSLLVLGGLGPTASPEFIDNNIFNTYVIGEGELAFLDILNDYQNNIEVKQCYVSSLIEDLDAIPFPARDLYQIKGGNIFSFGKEYHKGGSTGLITSRGCPFKCSYCATNAIWKRKVRFRSVENTLDEIQDCVVKFGIRQFRIQDDNFTLKKERLSNICQGILDRDLNIYWRCSTSASLIDTNILTLMKKSGCVEISYGAESGDPDVLKFLDRKFDIESTIESVKKAQEVGIKVRLFFMIGLPGTTSETAKRDINFLKRARPESINLAIYTPYPGSNIWKNPEKYGVTILTKNFEKYNMHLFSAEQRSLKSVISLDTINNDGLEAQKKLLIDYAKNAKIIHRVNHV